MGVPSFYRWLVNKYPKAVTNAIEERRESLDTSLPNPNGIEFDNLYLDMNEIIHPCFHPEEDEGETEELKLRRQFEMEGKQVLPKEEESEVCDSNIITPGTEFMHRLSVALKSYARSRLRGDLGWRNIKVILSDANVPGEGEHKIMSFIRQQRKLPSYNPNTCHCLYGLDADLIMLSLATHEVHFSILRENVFVQEQNHMNNKPVHDTSLSTAESAQRKSRGWFNNVLEDSADKCQASSIVSKPYQFLHVWIMREYLELDMRIADPPENLKHDLERIIDDFIFMCFFVGNDFLPHTPSLAIHEGAIDLLMTVYKKELKKIGGYLVDMNRVDDKKGGFIKLSRVERFILLVGEFEDKIFRKRSDLRERKLRRLCSQTVDQEDDGFCSVTESTSCALINVQAQSKDSAIVSRGFVTFDYNEMVKNTKELKEKVKHNLRRKSDLIKDGSFGVDKVKLGSLGYKERYYREKFSAKSPGEIESLRIRLVEKYTEGLLWVLLYYYSGPPSWTWFYPYHYGPFLSDLKGLSQVKLRFQKGVPFKPFDQLLSVLPPRSGHALPKAYQALMNDDSPIVDFYPTDFEIDVDGKRFSWQGICKLPFIDEGRLLSETAKLEKDLGVEERERNSKKLDQLFVRSTHNLGSHILSLSIEQNVVERGISLSNEICGILWLHHEHTVMNKEDVHKRNEGDSVLCMLYDPPDCGPHVPRLLDRVERPEPIVKEGDLEDTQLWHESKPPNRYTNIQHKFGNLSISSNSAAKSSGQHKITGSGWGAGRGGRTNSTNYESRVLTTSRRESYCLRTSHNNNAWRQNIRSDSGYGRGTGTGRGQQPFKDFRENKFIF